MTADHKPQGQSRQTSPADPNELFAAASSLVEVISSNASSAVYLYDLASQLGIGTLAQDKSDRGHGAPLINMETRSGAGMALLGRLSGQTSTRSDEKPITALTTPKGLAHIAPSLELLPNPSKYGRLILQVANVDTVDQSLDLVPSIAALALVLPILPPSLLVLASSEPREILNISNLIYGIKDKHVIHIYDHYASGREVQRLTLPHPSPHTTFENALHSAGYRFFDYYGPATAQSVIVVANGPLALLLKTLVHSPALEGGFGVVVVRVLSPWRNEELLSALPTSTQRLYVVDEVPKNFFGSPYLFSATLGSIIDHEELSSLVPTSLPLTPAMIKVHIDDPTSFVHHIHPTAHRVQLPPTVSKKLAFWTPANSPPSKLPSLVSRTFNLSRSTLTRHTTEYDLIPKPGVVAFDRISLSPAALKEADTLPLTFSIPIDAENGGADMLVVGDQALLKSHDVLRVAKPGSSVLVFSTWSADEFHSNLGRNVWDVILQSNLRLYLINLKLPSKSLSESSSGEIETALAYIAFSRVYLGKSGSRHSAELLGKSVLSNEVGGVKLAELSRIVWESLIEVDINGPIDEESTSSPSHTFSFNSVTSPIDLALSSESSVPILGSRTDVAKHLLFREAFLSNDALLQADKLRPDLQEETFLVTCSVNRRLTPTTYDRNIFHLEFDTSGTGLKYAIGEALGVHGWNDENDVSEFCSWYGIDPDKVVMLPVPETGGTKMHCRTVFQALQQQIDIFGRPPKSFYAALAEHATAREERMALLFIAAPEGSATFKKMGEVDTVTFAEVLHQFKSARPSFEKLAELVGDIKPRHYSIASAMSAVGDRVDLLVVTVEWVSPNGI